MQTLIVEDDFTSRKLIQELLKPYGEADIAVNGKEALEAFRASHANGRRYDLICLDIMMPEMDGHETLREIRRIEADAGIESGAGVKIMMTTALQASKNIMQAFTDRCEAYLVKPIHRDELVRQLTMLGLIDGDDS